MAPVCQASRAIAWRPPDAQYRTVSHQDEAHLCRGRPSSMWKMTVAGAARFHPGVSPPLAAGGDARQLARDRQQAGRTTACSAARAWEPGRTRKARTIQAPWWPALVHSTERVSAQAKTIRCSAQTCRNNPASPRIAPTRMGRVSRWWLPLARDRSDPTVDPGNCIVAVRAGKRTSCKPS